MDLTTATPVEIDRALAEIYGRLAKAEHRVALAEQRLNGHHEFQAKVAAGERGYYNYGDPAAKEAELLGHLETYRAAWAAIAAETHPYDAEYARRPWNRYWLVDNNGGHVHRTRACRTCYATTQFTWLVDLAAATDDEVIREAGALTCLECFPNVREEILAQRPTELVENPEKRAARKEREAKKEAKAKADAEKAIIDPATGKALREVGTVYRTGGVTDGAEIKNWKTAQTMFIDEAAYLRGVAAGYPAGRQTEAAATVARFAPALAAKRGITEAELLADLEKKIAKKARDWYGA